MTVQRYLGPRLSNLAMHAPTVWDVPMCDIICCVQIDRVCILLELRPRLMQPACNGMSSNLDRERSSAGMHSAGHAASILDGIGELPQVFQYIVWL